MVILRYMSQRHCLTSYDQTSLFWNGNYEIHIPQNQCDTMGWLNTFTKYIYIH